MESYTISGPSQVSGLSGADVTSSKTLSAGAKTITVTAADSRGRTTSASQNVTFLEYSYPALTTFKAVRGTYSNGSWTTSETGDHIRVQAVGSVSLSSQGNAGTKTVKIGTTNPNATSGNYYYFTSTNANTAYKVTGTITDSVGNTTTRGLTVPSISVPFNVDVDLPGAAAGMVSQHANEFEIANDWALVANGKYNRMLYMPYSWSTNGGSSSSSGYARIATVTITNSYANAPITFEVARRGDSRSVRLHLQFSSSSGTDPSLASFTYESIAGATNFAAFVYKTGTSVWDVFVRKTENADTIGVMTFVSSYMQGRTTITYASSIQASVPTGATSATSL